MMKLQEQLAASRSRLIVYGTGYNATRFVEMVELLREFLSLSIERFIDSNAEKQGQFFCGKQIDAPETLMDLDGDCCLVVAAKGYYREIAAALERRGLRENKDFFSDNTYVEAACRAIESKCLAHSEVTEKIAWLLHRSKGKPLFLSSPEGVLLKRWMLSTQGKALRERLPALRPHCKSFPKQLILLSNGDLSSCCFDVKGRQVLGNVFETDLRTVWETAVRSMVEGDLYDSALCRDCIGASADAALTSGAEEYEAWQSEARAALPDGLQLDIMAACNYKCPCPAGEMHRYRKPLKMDLPRVFERIAPYLPQLKYLHLFHFGEPLLNDGLGSFILRCREVAPQIELVLSTNGMLLDEEKARQIIAAQVDLVIFSVHGAPGTENLARYSGGCGDYEKVLENIRRLLALRNRAGRERPKVHLKTALFHWNDTDELMERYRADARGLGLRPADGNFCGGDIYYWVIDLTRSLASKKYTPHSEALNELIKRGEFLGMGRDAQLGEYW